MTLPTHREIELPLLKEILVAGGEIRPKDVYSRLHKYFPAITDEDLAAAVPSGTDNLWANRIRWARQYLVNKGEIHREPRSVWRITPKGEARAKGETLPADVAQGKATSPAPAAVSGAVPSIVIVGDPTEALCDRLTRAQKQSSTPKLFEAALADAFSSLGFDVQPQGKSGETDVLLDAHIGSDSYRAVIDAKATQGDRVSDNQINWLAIGQHQVLSQAEHAAIIGIDFGGGNLQRWASDHKVALIRTGELVEILRMHRQTPFSPTEMRPLFSTPGRIQQPLRDLRALHRRQARSWRLLVEVVEVFEAYNRRHKSGLHATAGTIEAVLSMRPLSHALGDVDPAEAPSVGDVRDALIFLSSKAVGILRETPDGSETYRLVMHLDTAMNRIAALARALEDGDVGAAVGSVSPTPDAVRPV
jgi:hypothetical protein